MKATCPSCNAHLNVDDKKIPAGGARIKCPTCQNIFPVKPGAGAVPLPGATQTSTQAPGAVPLPGGGQRGEATHVPLPGSSASHDSDWEDAPTRMQPAFIPPEAVPGATTTTAPPSNINEVLTRKQPSYKPPSVSATGTVPLPGASAPAPHPQTDFSSFEPTAGASVPLPGGAVVSPPTQPVPAARGQVPLPGRAGSYEPTEQSQLNTAQTARIPTGGKVPLPGAHAAATQVGPGAHAAATQVGPMGGAVPLPGSLGTFDTATTQSATARVPLPGSHGAHTQVTAPGFEVPSPSEAATHVGRPGARAPSTGVDSTAATVVSARRGVPLPGASSQGPGQAAFDAPTQLQRGLRDGRVPLPGPEDHRAATTDVPAFQSSAFGFDNEPTTAASSPLGDVPEASGADFAEVPQDGGSEPPAMQFDLPPPQEALAPSSAEPTHGGFDFSAPSEPAPAPASTGFDFSAPSEPAPAPASTGFDFSNLPAPADAPAAPASQGGGFDFSNLPSPTEPARAPASQSSGFDFSDLPAPAPASGAFELDNSAPPAAAPSGFDFAPPAPEPKAHAAPSFGEVDLGGGESLEFDPSAPAKRDDLEADLSAPLPPPKPAAPADGLEMLSFIDDSAKEAGVKDTGTARRFHIKRRSGKVFGPFEEAVVVKMLEDGQLLGNEEVSTDAESWQPIGSEVAFQAAIAKLMEQPVRAPAAPTAAAPAAPAAGNRPAPPSMERLKQLYEGRMAAVAVVQGTEPVPFKKRIPLIVGAVAVLAVAGAGAWSSQTRYGLFGLKVLFPAKVSANTEEFKTLTEAKKSLLTDTFKSYKSSKELCEKLLRTKPYPEVRAVWMQSVYWLARRYSGATPGDLQTAQAEQENILLLGEKHVEVVKALAQAALYAKDNDKALSLVASAKARAENDGDLELLFLKAEAQAAKGQVPQAMTDLKEVLTKDKTSAKALHALGLLHLKQKELDLAAGRFAEALAANPAHASSAVELAAIELVERKDRQKGSELLEQSLTEEHRVNLAPAELGRALAMKAQTLVADRKVEEAVAAFEEALKADPQNVFAKGAYGALLVDRHDYAKASPMLKDVVEKAPGDLANIEAYLNSLIGLGKMDEATKVMQSASGRFPGNARIAFLSGRVEDGMDRTKQAEESYKRAISADANMVEANVALAHLYLRLRRFSEAKPQLEQASSKAPDNAQVHIGLGELAVAENDIELAQAELNKAAELNPNLPGAFLGLSRVALAKGTADVAEQQALKALKLDPKIHDGRLQYGTALWKLGRLDDAIRELTQAKDDDPRSINIPITLGAVALDKGDLDAATANLLGNALQKEPGNPDANYYMARVKRKRAEYTQAIELMKKAIDHAPKRREFHYELGNIFMDARKGNEALDEWKAALAIDEKYADALEALGKSSLERNRQKEAIDYFERALESDPSRTRIFASIGDAHVASTQWPKAIDAYLKALAAQPLKEVYPKLAYAYGERKKWAEAITWYRKAVQASPEDQQAWYSLGYALKEKRQFEEAITAFTEFLKLNQDPKLKKEIGDVIYDLKQER